MLLEVSTRSGVPLLLSLLSSFSVACAGEPDASSVSGTDVVRDTTMSADGVPIAYEALGSGAPALVFVHGWSCDGSYWSGQLQAFARDHRVVAMDLAGHGDSGRNREEWTIAAYGADVAAVVDALGLERVILIGHSMGGDVVVDAARLLPDRVAGLVWVDTYSQLGHVRSPEEVEAFLAPFRANFADSTYAIVRRNLFHPSADSALAEGISRDMASAPPDIALASLESSITNDGVVPRLLKELNLPVISINPERTNPDIASLERHGVEVVVMPGVGHFMMMVAPERLNTVLGDVVAELVVGESHPPPARP